jgi:multiple sugar transport system permease protein
MRRAVAGLGNLGGYGLLMLWLSPLVLLVREGWPALWEPFTLVPFAQGLFNSLLWMGFSVLVAVISASALAFWGHRRLELWLLMLLLSLLPVSTLWLPRFVMAKMLGLPAFLMLLLPALANALAVLLYLLAFRRLKTLDLLVLEGLSFVQQWRMALAQVWPTTALVALVVGLQSWNAYAEPLLYLKTQKMQTAILLLHTLDLLGSTAWDRLMAAVLWLLLPPLLLWTGLALRTRTKNH